jgi:hypothetical protein
MENIQTAGDSQPRRMSLDQAAVAKALARAQALKWVAIFLLALTVVDRLEPLLKLATLVGKIVRNWREITHWFWSHVFGVFNISIAPDTVAALNMASFLTALAIHSARSEERARTWVAFLLWWLNIYVVYILLMLIYIAQSMQYGYPVSILETPTLNAQYQPTLTFWAAIPVAFKLLLESFQADPQPYVRNAVVMFTFWTIITSNQLALFKTLVKVACIVLILAVLNGIALHAPVIKELLN